MSRRSKRSVEADPRRDCSIHEMKREDRAVASRHPTLESAVPAVDCSPHEMKRARSGGCTGSIQPLRWRVSFHGQGLTAGTADSRGLAAGGPRRDCSIHEMKRARSGGCTSRAIFEFRTIRPRGLYLDKAIDPEIQRVPREQDCSSYKKASRQSEPHHEFERPSNPLERPA